MAKKKKSTAKVKPSARAKRAPAKAKAPAAKSVPQQQAVIEAIPVAEPVPQPPARHQLFSPREITALVLGGLLLTIGVVGVLQRPAPDTPTNAVKQQTIPMSMDDFKDDPAIQEAIQKQLGGQSGAAQTPQKQHSQSPQSAGGSLQAPDSNPQR